jgi:hypothetical protein
MKQITTIFAMILLVSMSWAAESSTEPMTEMTGDAPATESATTSEVAADEATTATEASTDDAATAADEQTGFSRGNVARSVFTTAIQDREPTDKIKQSSEENRIYYFTELRDMSGQTATHRWEYNGKVMAEVNFDVRGPRWRVWSSKNFVPGWEGEWKVSVLNGAGEVISEDVFMYTPVAATDAASDAQAQPATEEPAAGDATEPPASPSGMQTQ